MESSYSQLGERSKSVNILYDTFLALYLIELAIFIALVAGIDLFSYCFFTYLLSNLQVIRYPDTYSYSKSKDLFCSDDYDLSEVCDSFCWSLDSLKSSRYFFYIFGSVSMIFASLSILCLTIKLKRPELNFTKTRLYVLNTLALVFFALGFSLYCLLSNIFALNDVETEVGSDYYPNVNFTWEYGLTLCVIEIIGMAIHILVTRLLIDSLIKE